MLRRLLTDDASAWAELVAEYSGFLLAVVRKTFAGYGVRAAGQDHEDAVADVWKNLLEHDRRLVRTCIERGNFLQTLQVLARHRSVDMMRRRHANTIPLADTDAATVEPPSSPLDEVSGEAMRAALGELTPRERILVNLFFLQGKKYREIAVLTGIPLNSIGPTLARALARLRKAIKP